MTSSIPKVLTVAGSDSSGGAGIQADIKTFTALGVYASSVITSVTAQNSKGLQHRFDIPEESVKAQLMSLMKDINYSAIKIGMLPNEKSANVLFECLKDFTNPIILDPVIKSTSGSALVSSKANDILKEKIIPLSTIFTPNIPESAALLNQSEKLIRSDLHRSATELYKKYNTPVLLKGGHINGSLCIDTFFNGHDMKQFKNTKIETRNTHGTGCTLASCIAGYLALGFTQTDSVEKAIQQVQKALNQSDKLGLYDTGYGPINHLAIG